MWSGNHRHPQHSQDEWQSYSAKTSSRKSGTLTKTELERFTSHDFHTDNVFKVQWNLGLDTLDLEDSLDLEH